LVRHHIDLHLLDVYKRPSKLLVGAWRQRMAQQQALTAFNRFFLGSSPSLVDGGYDVSQQDIDWVIEHKEKFELENVANLLAFEHLRPIFLLWQLGERRE
jgi:hypothetical protein